MKPRYLALATDGDRTLTTGERLARATRGALERLRESGRKVILVTGEREDQVRSFAGAELFDVIVAEGGGVLFPRGIKGPAAALGPTPPRQLIAALRRRRVTPLQTGRVSIGTQAKQELAVREALWEMGLAYRLSFNREDMLLLPPGVDKGWGLKAALKELGVAASHTVGVGDGEIDLPFLGACGLAVAVANALPAVKQQADHVTLGRSGRGVVELIDQMLQDDLRAWQELSPGK